MGAGRRARNVDLREATGGQQRPAKAALTVEARRQKRAARREVRAGAALAHLLTVVSILVAIN